MPDLSKKVLKNNSIPRLREKAKKAANIPDIDAGIAFESQLEESGDINKNYGLTLGWKNYGLTITNQKLEIEFNFSGIGLLLSTENGGTAGLGLGIIGIEFNAEGGGSLSYLFDLYKIEVEVIGCTYVKQYFIAGVYAYAEVQEIPGCNPPEEREPLEQSNENLGNYNYDDLYEWVNDKKSGEPNWENYDFDSLGDGLLLVCFDWEQTRFFLGRLGDFDRHEKIIVRSSESVPIGDDFVDLIKYTGNISAGTGSCNFYHSVKYNKNTDYLYTGNTISEESSVDFSPGQIFGLSNFRRMSVEWWWDFSSQSWWNFTRKWRWMAPPVINGFMDKNIGLAYNLFPTAYLTNASNLKSFLRISGYSCLNQDPVPSWRTYYERKILDIRIYSKEGRVPLLEGKYSPPVPRLEYMKNNCCFTEDDRSLLAYIIQIIGGFNLPGKIGINDNVLSAKFPLEEGEELQEGDAPIHSLLELHLWRILNGSNTPVDSELTKKIALNLGVPVEGLEVTEQYPSSIKPQSSPDNYGFPFKVPKAWLEPGKSGEITIYNSKQLLLILGRMLAENYQALRSDELLHEGVEYENKWTTPGGTGTTKVWNYLELFEVLARQADHLGIHPFVGEVADLNPAKPGDQPLNTPTLNATHAIKMIYESIKETDGDQAAALNLNLRESILLGQLALAVASMSETLISIAEVLGFEVSDAVDVFDGFPFDFTLGAEAEVTGGKGFAEGAQAKYIAQLEKAYKKIVAKLVDNTEESAEAVLERFLVAKPQQFIYKKLKANSSILEVIRNAQSK